MNREKPNRFIAYCEIGGERENYPVKNTGRSKGGGGVFVQLRKFPIP